MVASLFVNAMQVDFTSVLAMEHTGMVRMFKSLEETGLKGFQEVSNSVFEGAFTEFFANAKVIAGTIVLVAMVNNPNRQSQGFAVQISVLLKQLVKADLGEAVKLHQQKTADTASGTEDRQSQMTKTMEKEVERAVEKPKKRKEKVVQMVKKQKVAVQQPVEARSQAAPVKSTSETSSDTDSCPLARLNKGEAKRKTNKVTHTADHQNESQPGPIPEIPTGGDKESTAGGPEATMEMTPEVEKYADDTSNAAALEERVECENQTEKEGQDGCDARTQRGHENWGK
ncbi:hypothetical protein F511_37465 [Dorcoceras hygrometricum]|uniref:Uncharacterized protein n=1 Tax=Dorcoceras hygrometricum TaxID=472368 RepID=A0A2Z7DDJ2_9LAMI|nr:hypothetical protein F511_37465 [Dorcoceras hygrometricum]